MYKYDKPLFHFPKQDIHTIIQTKELKKLWKKNDFGDWVGVSVLESPDLKNRVLSKCMSICLSACSVGEKSTYSITTKYVYAHSLQHAMARVVSEATGRTLAEGEWGRRTSRSWVFCNFGLHTSTHYREILFYQVTSWQSEWESLCHFLVSFIADLIVCFIFEYS